MECGGVSLVWGCMYLVWRCVSYFGVWECKEFGCGVYVSSLEVCGCGVYLALIVNAIWGCNVCGSVVWVCM